MSGAKRSEGQKLFRIIRSKLEKGSPIQIKIDNFFPPEHRTRAAVLVPIIILGGEVCAVYIKRTTVTDGLGNEVAHSGQIAFPGGKIESGESPQTAALREAEEEIALPAKNIEIIAAWGMFPTITTKFAAHVFIGLVDELPPLRANPAEVASIHRVPLRELLAQHRKTLDFQDFTQLVSLHYHWHDPTTNQPICIWGMTGRITWTLLQRLFILA